MSRARSRIAASLSAAALAVGLASCGGGDDDGGTPVSADSSPEEVLDVALGGGGDPIESGVLDLELSLDGGSEDVGSIDASIKGPFSANGDGELPDLDFDVTAGAEVNGPTLSFSGGLILTGDGLWVNYQDQDYQLDDQAFAELKDSYSQSSQLQEDENEGGSLSQFGVDPQDWLTDVTNEGTEDIDGTETVHVSGTGDIKRIVQDLDSVAEKSGQQQLEGGQLDELESSIDNAQVDVYAATDDGTLRRLDVTLDVANGGGAGTSTVTLSVGIADPNSDQDISVPEDAQPLSELLGQLPVGADSLGGLAPSTGGDSSGGSGGSDAYYQCVQQAPTPDAVNDCSRYLQ